MSRPIIACICEGSSERVIINKLMDAGKLKFSREDLLDHEVIHCRSAGQFENRYLGKEFTRKITVYRILDSRREVFKLKKVYQEKVDVVNVITAPEIEMLIIIHEGRYSDYSKVKSTTKPSEFCKQVLRYSDVKSAKFITNYFSDIETLVHSIKEYQRLSNISKNELCLADLLK